MWLRLRNGEREGEETFAFSSSRSQTPISSSRTPEPSLLWHPPDFLSTCLGTSSLTCNLKKEEMIFAHFQGKPFNITVILGYATTDNAEEAEAEWLYEDIQDLLKLTPRKDIPFILGEWNAKVGSKEIPGITGKFCLGIQTKHVKGEQSFANKKHWS